MRHASEYGCEGYCAIHNGFLGLLFIDSVPMSGTRRCLSNGPKGDSPCPQWPAANEVVVSRSYPLVIATCHHGLAMRHFCALC